MKKFLSLVLALVMTMSLVTVSAGAKDFTDSSKINYAEAVDVLSEAKVIDGYAEGDFRPTATLTRGAAAKIICNLILGPTTASALVADAAPYKDVPTNHTFAGYIAYCQKTGIISGYADGTFKPANSLTGYAFMKMLLGALGYDSAIEGYTGANWSIAVAKQAINAGDMAKAQQICDKQQGCVANVVGASIAAYKEMENTPNLKRAAKVAKIQQAHEEATQLEMPTLQMNMPILATIVTLGTLTALFGTVVGMIRSFAALASGGGGDSLQLSEGISEALVNTASGILTSWFAVVSYNYYSNKIDKLTYALDEVGYTIAQTYEANHADEA